MKATLTPDQARGKWVAYMRDLLDLNQAEFADLVGVHINTVSRTENGRRPVDSRELDKLCKFFEVDYNWWFNPVVPPIVEIVDAPTTPPQDAASVGGTGAYVDRGSAVFTSVTDIASHRKRRYGFADLKAVA